MHRKDSGQTCRMLGFVWDPLSGGEGLKKKGSQKFCNSVSGKDGGTPFIFNHEEVKQIKLRKVPLLTPPLIQIFAEILFAQN